MTPREAAYRDVALWQQAYRAAGWHPAQERFAAAHSEAFRISWGAYKAGRVSELKDFEALLEITNET